MGEDTSNVGSVRAWHVRERYVAEGEDDNPNWVMAYCPVCKVNQGAYGRGGATVKVQVGDNTQQ